VLAFVGVVTFQRLVQSSFEDIAYAQRIGRLRDSYLAVAPELEPYVLVIRGQRADSLRDDQRLSPSSWQLTLTTAGMVAVVNSVVIGACAGLLLERLRVGPLAITLAVGATIGTATLLIQRSHRRRARYAHDPEAVDRAGNLRSGSKPGRGGLKGGAAMSRKSRGFHGRRPEADSARIPPGQYVVDDFPVLSAGPTPHTPLDEWSFTVRGAVDEPVSWSWDEFTALSSETVTVDIHCVTKWSKLDTSWTGVAIDTLLEPVETSAGYVLAFCDGGYTTNLPLDDLTSGQAWIAYEYGGEPLEPEHGGPARLLVPHLYFWKSAKWVRGIELRDHDEPGFWEEYGYHNYGDPWTEQRYWSD
jgi:DMSO/TMAO reductase YedYZ molybdopterin-dependent catalytic subunit